MDREEAIAWFRARGVDASKRDWSLGASIFIPASPPRQHKPGDIIAYDRVFYLYPHPRGDGSWRLWKVAERESETSYPDLESAARAALDALTDSGDHKGATSK